MHNRRFESKRVGCRSTSIPITFPTANHGLTSSSSATSMAITYHLTTSTKSGSDKTVVFANPTAAAKLDEGVNELRPGESATVGALKIRTIPAYTITKLRASGEPTHPKENEHLGLILEIDDLTFYAAGDTDVIPEMESVGPVDYAFLPVSGKFVMTPDEAAEAVRIVQPSVAIPVHFGAIVGSREDAQRFAELVPDQVRVWIMTPASGE